VEVPLLLQFSIALFTGMIAATLVPPVRRSIPKAVEVLLWIALVTACVLGVVSITDPNARELSTSAVWAADQIVNTLVGLTFGGVVAWISDHRFSIASWMVIVGGADIFALMFIGSWRRGRAWQPRVRLREWMELPVPVAPAPTRAVIATDPLANVNRRLAAATALVTAAAATKMLDASIRFRDLMLPLEAHRLARAAAVGRSSSQARLEALRDASAHLQYAAGAWYTAAGEPAINGIAVMAGDAARAAQRSLRPVRLRPGQVIDIRALLSAQTIGWYGPMNPAPMPQPLGELDDPEPQESDRLAS
jgi:hypothetical protein